MKKISVLLLAALFAACSSEKDGKTSFSVHLITVDPGHFHAALVQKSMYPDVDSVVQVYAPEGDDLQQHMDRISAYNHRADNPTNWKEKIFIGSSFFNEMISQKKGNVVVLAGNNGKKTSYIKTAVDSGFNVLADKPMAIDRAGFETLKSAFESAKKNNVLLYDIMTERYEITTILQRELSMLPEVFGKLEQGTAENPAVTKESVHYFYKYVSGKVLVRPPWFMDVAQQGEGIVDVTTHLVDLVQWECFPEKAIDIKNINMLAAKRWPTDMTLSQFKTITGINGFPGYLKKDVVQDSVLKIFANGEMSYTINGVHARVSVRWNYKAPEGTSDTHNSVMRGTKANLVIKQGAEQQYKPELYIEQAAGQSPLTEQVLQQQIEKLQAKYPGIALKKVKNGWWVTIPESFKEGHEAHFARVMEKFLEYFKNKNMPAWEVPNMIAKYYTTTAALEMAKAGK
ncbi:putative oxidoreductase C-terminal domain-containing protein [Mucilaginibacter calamicampi]|uniref:Oxidoreductase C-terminal domain-containing protein n=1 Tax=Mucilaginibacter calamicampi TaxID=1302352 RepID=A0ABW2Z180_9SPHI